MTRLSGSLFSIHTGFVHPLTPNNSRDEKIKQMVKYEKNISHRQCICHIVTFRLMYTLESFLKCYFFENRVSKRSNSFERSFIAKRIYKFQKILDFL